MVLLTRSFRRKESGATMVEYAVLVALIAVAVIATVGILGTQIDAAFQQVVDELTEVVGENGGE